MTRKLLRGLAPTGIVLGSLLCAGVMWTTQSTRAEGQAQENTLTAVTVVGVERGPVQLAHTTVGEVVAAHDVPILSEVSGTLSWVDPGVHAGMFVAKGQVVARLDPTAFDAEVAAAASTLASAQEELALEQGSGHVAALEARLVGDIADADPALIRREPQLAAAKASVTSAEAALAEAERARNLTRIRAPFDAILAEEDLDVGRLVTTSTQLGRWVGTARAEVSVPVPTSALAWFERGTVQAELRPRGGAAGEVRVAHSVGPTGLVDPTTRTARVLVRVDAPYDTSEGPALLPGSFVDVTLRGGALDDASTLPVEALVDGGAVWHVGPENTLYKVDVDVLWRAGDEVVISGVDGLDRVIARPTGTLLEGQTVQVRGQRGEG